VWPAAPHAVRSTTGKSLLPYPGLDVCSIPAFTLGQGWGKADYFYSTMYWKSYSVKQREGNESHQIGKKEGIKLARWRMT